MNRYAAIAAAAVVALSSSVASAQAAAAGPAPAADPKKAAPPAAAAQPAPAAAEELDVRRRAERRVEEAQLQVLLEQEKAARAQRDAAEAAHRAQVERITVIAPDGANADQFVFTPAVAARRMEKGTFLGVNASPAPASVREQLKLTKNTGLVVEQVVPDSPAAAAGLKEHDVIVRLDDQLLINTQQLVVLVRTYKPSDEVKLSIVRQGQPSELKVKLVEKDLPALDEQGNAISFTPAWPQPPMAAQAVEAFLDLGGGDVVVGDAGGAVGGGGRVVNRIRLEPPAAVGADIAVGVADGAPQPRLFTRRIQAGNGKMVMRDNDYEVELNGAGAQRIAKITEVKTGKVIVEGPIESREVKQAMSPDLLKRVEMLIAQSKVAEQGVMVLNRGAARRAQEINWSDGEKDLHIFAKEIEGKRETRLVVKDIAGRVLFEGPIDTGDQRKQLPDDIAEKLTQALLANVPVKP